MAGQEYVARLKQGVKVWNAWRKEYPEVTPDLREADLGSANLTRANLRGADLREANLSGAYLIWADLRGADLRWTDLREANLSGGDLSGAVLFQADLSKALLSGADLSGSILSGADLSEAVLIDTVLQQALLTDTDLIWTNLTGANLSKATLESAHLFETLFANTRLAGVKGLTSCQHHGPSTLDHRTLRNSGKLPIAFLQGCGLPDNLIEHFRSRFTGAAQFHSSFIFYSHKDEPFVQKLHRDLQNGGVRCWLAPRDIAVPAKVRDALEDAVKPQDRLLLIFSENSVESDWIEKEAQNVRVQERKHKQAILFPIRIDDAIMECKAAWAKEVKRVHDIRDFTNWEKHDSYQKSFNNLIYGSKKKHQKS